MEIGILSHTDKTYFIANLPATTIWWIVLCSDQWGQGSIFFIEQRLTRITGRDITLKAKDKII